MEKCVHQDARGVQVARGQDEGGREMCWLLKSQRISSWRAAMLPERVGIALGGNGKQHRAL